MYFPPSPLESNGGLEGLYKLVIRLSKIGETPFPFFFVCPLSSFSKVPHTTNVFLAPLSSCVPTGGEEFLGKKKSLGISLSLPLFEKVVVPFSFRSLTRKLCGTPHLPPFFRTQCVQRAIQDDNGFSTSLSRCCFLPNQNGGAARNINTHFQHSFVVALWAQ